MKKKLAAALICLSMAAASLTACGGDTTSTPAATQEAAKTETPAAGGEAASGDVKEITEAIAEGPIILTSVGQSADVNVVQTLLKKCEIDSDLNATVTADDLGSYKTLVLAIGGSSKGLGAVPLSVRLEYTQYPLSYGRNPRFYFNLASCFTFHGWRSFYNP